MKKIQAPCSDCFASTFHNILRSVEHEIPRSWWPEDRELLLESQPGDIDWRPDTFEIIECAGTMQSLWSRLITTLSPFCVGDLRGLLKRAC